MIGISIVVKVASSLKEFVNPFVEVFLDRVVLLSCRRLVVLQLPEVAVLQGLPGGRPLLGGNSQQQRHELLALGSQVLERVDLPLNDPVVAGHLKDLLDVLVVEERLPLVEEIEQAAEAEEIALFIVGVIIEDFRSDEADSAGADPADASGAALVLLNREAKVPEEEGALRGVAFEEDVFWL